MNESQAPVFDPNWLYPEQNSHTVNVDELTVAYERNGSDGDVISAPESLRLWKLAGETHLKRVKSLLNPIDD